MVVATPQQVTAGATLTVTGANFRQRASGKVQLGTATLGSFKTDGGGRFSLVVTIPRATAAGWQTIKGVVGPTTASTPIVVSMPGTIALGAWVPGAPWDAAQLDAFATKIGRMPAVVQWYQGWVNPDPANTRFNPTLMNTITSRGAMPLLTWEPWDYTKGVNQPAFALRTIAAGDHDAFIHQWARDAAAWGQPFYLRFAHEMNGDWVSWGQGVNGNTSADYIAAWQHVVTIFRQEGATNVRWVWSPNIHYDGLVPFTQLYPGDAWVDWVALDGYNWGTSQPWSNWQSFAQIFGSSYTMLTGMTSKPVMISETASAEQGGDKAGWITQGLLTDLQTTFPRVRALIWFSENTTSQADWRVDSSTASLTAFRAVAANPAFQGTLP
jgi:hypothetical protein